MREPSCFDWLRHIVEIQRLHENLATPVEMTAHDWMFCVHLVQRAALIFYLASEKASCQLILHFFDASAICVTKKKTDHAVIKHSVDKSIDDRSELRLASELLKRSRVHGGKF